MRGYRPLFSIGVIVMFAAFSLAVMLLWNAILPNLLGVADINYLQAAGILALCRLLFGGLGLGGIRPGMRGLSRDEREELMRRAHEHFARRWGRHPGCSGSGHHGRAHGEPDDGAGRGGDGNDR